MLEPKEKICKGINKANGVNGCGKLTKFRTFGLCNNCLSDFLFDSDAGKLVFQKRIMPKVDISLKKIKHKKTKEQRESLLTPDKYRSTILQPNINKIARLIDYGCSCIATNNFGKMAGGHRISVGANRTTSLNLHNIHIQSFASNSFKGGDNLKYNIGIKNRYGNEYLEFLDTLHQTPSISLTVKDMQNINSKALNIIKRINTNLIEKTPLERIKLRNEFNLELGIYEKNFSVYG